MGLYHTETGMLHKINPVNQSIMVGNKVIPFKDINTLEIIGRAI